MKRSISWYFKRSRAIVREEGLTELIKRVREYYPLRIRMRLDKCITRFLSRFYIKGFHKLYYYFVVASKEKGFRWLGLRIVKNPIDCWTYHEIIYETKPDVIIETGTYRGGCLIFSIYV